MKIWKLKPYEGINDFKLGSIREPLLDELGIDPQTGLRGRKMLDTWPEHHLRFTYNDRNRVDTMEVLPPAEAHLDGLNWLELPYAEAAEALRQRDAQVYVIANSLISLELGLAIRFESMEDSAQPVWAAVFERGFFDSLLEKLQAYQKKHQES